MRVTVIGALGFVGSAFVSRLAEETDLEVIEVTRLNYSGMAGMRSDVVIEASCNAKKYLADERPVEEFDLSVSHRLRTLRDFPADLHVHISSVDVYSDLTTPETTREDLPIEPAGGSRYGLHKSLAEQLVRHYADRWLIVRLAGMVGPGLRKNPVYDILNGQPLRIHPDSLYQFMATSDVAGIVRMLIKRGVSGEIFNVCGEGLISPREIARLAEREMNLSQIDSTVQPRIVHVNTEKIGRITAMPETRRSVADFIESGFR
jgi:nucleoside-diphosphate-sugar epimerase